MSFWIFVLHTAEIRQVKKLFSFHTEFKELSIIAHLKLFPFV